MRESSSVRLTWSAGTDPPPAVGAACRRLFAGLRSSVAASRSCLCSACSRSNRPSPVLVVGGPLKLSRRLCGRIHPNRDTPGLDRTNAGDPRSPMPDRHGDRGPPVRLVVAPCLRRPFCPADRRHHGNGRLHHSGAPLQASDAAAEVLLRSQVLGRNPGRLPDQHDPLWSPVRAGPVFPGDQTLAGMGERHRLPAAARGLGNRQHPGQPNRGPAGAQRLHVHRFADRRERLRRAQQPWRPNGLWRDARRPGADPGRRRNSGARS